MCLFVYRVSFRVNIMQQPYEVWSRSFKRKKENAECQEQENAVFTVTESWRAAVFFKSILSGYSAT